MANGLNNRVPDIETVSFDENGEIVGNNPIKRFFLLILIVLISTLSFGLGRLSNEGSRDGVKIEYDSSLQGITPLEQGTMKLGEEVPKVEASVLTSSEVVGSIKGTKYHYSHCSGARQISEANKIIFKNAALAEAAGYTLALNCKPR